MKGVKMASCITPMIREYIDYTLEEKLAMKAKGQKQYNRIVPRQEVARLLTTMNPNEIRTLEEINEYNRQNHSRIRYQTIACQNCWACRLKKSAEWATRCICEAKEHPDSNYWITLTYNDENLPIAQSITYKHYLPINKYTQEKYIFKTIENVGDEIWGEGCLIPEDLKRFMNTLRKKFERKGHTGIKFLAAGEYGSINHRPHFHICLFNCPLSIDMFYDMHVDENFKMTWKSEEIDQCWKKGIAQISELEWSNAAYTCRYTTKKIIDGTKTEEEYAKQGKIKEFIRMSNRPGIGNQYYEKHKNEIYKNDILVMKTIKGNIGSIKPPKAWDKKFMETHPEAWEILKKCREQAAKRAADLQRQLTDYTDKEMLKLNKEKILEKGKLLPRLDM